MADENAAPIIPAPAAAPVIATPAPAAPAAAEAAPAIIPATPAPVASPAEAAPTATPAPAAAPAAADGPSSILSEAQPATPTPVAVAPVVPAEPAAPPPPPVYESFKLPDGVQLDATKVTDFQKMLGDFEVTNKADHAQMQAFGQQMVDLFVAEQQRSQTELVNSFNQIRETWKTEIKADPTFGGQNMGSTTAAAGALIEQYGGTKEEVASLRNMLRITGAGDNPHLIRLFARVGKSLVQEGKPVPAVVPKSPATVSKSARRYGNTAINGSGS